MELGVDPYAMDNAGWNSLIHAAAGGYEKMVNWLLVRTLLPPSYPTPDPSMFLDQNIGNSIIGMPAWAFAILVTCLFAGSIIMPSLTLARRFTQLRKPYICETGDDAIEEFMNLVLNAVDDQKKGKQDLGADWDKLPTHTLNNLHRPKGAQ